MRKPICMILALAMVFTLCACTSKNQTHQYAMVEEDNTVTYNTDESTDSLNYTLYVNKEIAMVLNFLEGHMANALYVKDGKYPIEDEIDNVYESLDMIAEAINSVEVLNPPNKYEDDRSAILRRMANIQNTLTDYKADLEAADLSDIEAFVDIMSGDFASLKSYYNNQWE